MNSFFQYVPNSYKISIGYTDNIQTKLDELSNGVDQSIVRAVSYTHLQYHEAWHRVSQLLIDPKHRDKIYKKYREQGLDVYKRQDLILLDQTS